MTRRAGSADLPLHGGHVPKWLADRMTRLGAMISEVPCLRPAIAAACRAGAAGPPQLCRSPRPRLGVAAGAHRFGLTARRLASVDRMVAEAAQQLGGLHILVNSGSAPGGLGPHHQHHGGNASWAVMGSRSIASIPARPAPSARRACSAPGPPSWAYPGRHLPHGGRAGGGIRRCLPGLGKGLGGLRRVGGGKRWGRAIGLLPSVEGRPELTRVTSE